MNFKTWFLSRLFSQEGYNLVNTTVFGLTLIFFAYLIFLVLKKLKVRIDERLALAISPFVLLGSSLRVLKDAKILHSLIFQTPGIYFLIFSITFSTLLFSLLLQKKFKVQYFKPMFLIGLIMTIFPLVSLNFKNWTGMLLVFISFVPFPLIIKPIKWRPENKLILSLHFFDSLTTSISIYFSGKLWPIFYTEQHPLPRFLMSFTSPFSFIPIKLLIVTLVLILLDKYLEEKEFRNYIKLIIGILGTATGLRDFLRLACLV